MFKAFKINESVTTIEISKEGKVTYGVDKKKTTFDLSTCNEFTYAFDAVGDEVVITEEMLTDTSKMEGWLWLVINKGEEQLEYNNNQRESRRHLSYSNQNDKIETLSSDENILECVLKNIEKEALSKAILSLEEKQQNLIMDLYYKEIPIVELAKRDGVTEAAIRNRRKKILKKIRKNLF